MHSSMLYSPTHDDQYDWSADLGNHLAAEFGWAESKPQKWSPNLVKDEDWEKQFGWMIAAEFGWTLTIEQSTSGDLYKVPLSQSRLETRLITILPGTGSEISCCLRTVSLADNPSFNALSYVWGDPNDTRNIKVNGITIAITKNLAGALRRIRHFGSGRYASNLWIDALSINQTDLSDKEYQIPLMNKVYSNAKTVVAWMGQWGSSIDQTFELYKQISENKRKNVVDQHLLTRALCMTTEINSHLYWQRLWVVQELCLARSSPIMLSDRNHISLAQLLDSNNTIGYNSATTPMITSEVLAAPRVRTHTLEENKAVRRGTYNMQSLQQLRSLLRDQEQTNITGEVVKAAIFRKTSKPVDRVYALLGMLDPCTRSKFPIDYQADYMSVYKDLFTLLWTLDHLDSFPSILFSPSHRVQSQYPSWVPDLSNQNDKIIFPALDLKTTRWMGGSSASLSDDGRFIFADGIWLGDVVFTSSCKYSAPNPLGFNNLQEILASQLIESLSAIHHGIMPWIPDTAMLTNAWTDTLDEELLARLMFPLLRVSEGIIPSLALLLSNTAMMSPFIRKEWFSNFWDAVIACRDPTSQAKKYFASMNEDESVMTLMHMMILVKFIDIEFCERKVFVTKYGITGTAPKEINEGDLLVRLHGLSEVMLLRREPAGHFIIIGSVNTCRYKDNGQLAMDRFLSEGKLKIRQFKIG